MRYFRRSVACRLRKVIIPLYSALVRLHPKYRFGIFSQFKRDVNKLEGVVLHQSKSARGLKHTACEERLRKPSLFSLVRRRLRAYNYLEDSYKKDGATLFLRVPKNTAKATATNYSLGVEAGH